MSEPKSRNLKVRAPLPSEDEVNVVQLERIDKLCRAITRPMTDDEARVLIELFGPDGCYGIASSFMHLIETAPGWPLRECQEEQNNEWKIELRNRVLRGDCQC